MVAVLGRSIGGLSLKRNERLNSVASGLSPWAVHDAVGVFFLGPSIREHSASAQSLVHNYRLCHKTTI